MVPWRGASVRYVGRPLLSGNNTRTRNFRPRILAGALLTVKTPHPPPAPRLTPGAAPRCANPVPSPRAARRRTDRLTMSGAAGHLQVDHHVHADSDRWRGGGWRSPVGGIDESGPYSVQPAGGLNACGRRWT